MRAQLLFTAAAALLAATPVLASVQISSNPTQNMSCASGVCSPTAKKSNLNTTDLANMLATSDVKVVTGAAAVSIGLLSPLTWTSTHRLTLDAIENIYIKAPVVVEGTAGLTITTNDGGTGGDLMIYPGGKVDFWDTSSSLIINGNNYALVSDLKTLSKDIHANLEGFYALANDYNTHSKKYSEPPIREFLGTFEGLGNTIANLDIEGPVRNRICEGLFGLTGKDGIQVYATIRDIDLKNVRVSTTGQPYVGALVGCKYGSIINASVDGNIASGSGGAGGLVGFNFGSIIRSRSAVSIESTTGSGGVAGGLVGVNYGVIDQSYATGDVTADGAGGLAGYSSGPSITNCYATGSVTAPGRFWGGGFAGGGQGQISSSYSTGSVTGESATLGGFIGLDQSDGKLEAAYWDLDTSGISDPHQGAGSIPDDPGVTGLTDIQLKSRLPAGFDEKVWAQSPTINNGYPYLIANPPPQ